MTNNLNTIEGAQQEVIDQFEYNLQAKGVLDAQFNPTTGLLGLINRIPDIEPSTNINLNITLTLTSAEPSVDYGGSILLSATLMASYEGASDVDLKTGEITGATITFKKGGSIIGTSITDNNGVATLLYTPVVADCDTTLNLSAVFSGTDNFNSANSNNINVDVNGTLELTSDKDILSYADNEYATLTATLNSADKNNKEVIFEVRKQSDDSLVETLTGNTDSSGNATVYYLGVGAGDLYIKGKCMNVSIRYDIKDAIKYDSSTHTVGNTQQVISLNYALPSEFKIEMTVHPTANDGCPSFIYLGATIENSVIIGHVSSISGVGVIIANNGSYVESSSTIRVNYYQDNKIVYTYSNGSHSITTNNSTVSLINSSISPSKILQAVIRNNCCKDLTILPL